VVGVLIIKQQAVASEVPVSYINELHDIWTMLSFKICYTL